MPSDTRSFPMGSFVRASSLHIGAAAATAALRRDLVDGGTLPASAFDEAYAIARLTPGTNFLAMYALLGERLAGWAGAFAALAVGTLVPTAIAVALASAYIRYAEYGFVADVMQGARAGALAVFVWAILRLLRPQLATHRGRGFALAVVTVALMALPIPQFVVLLIAGGIGAFFLRGDS